MMKTKTTRNGPRTRAVLGACFFGVFWADAASAFDSIPSNSSYSCVDLPVLEDTSPSVTFYFRTGTFDDNVTFYCQEGYFALSSSDVSDAFPRICGVPSFVPGQTHLKCGQN